MADLESRSLVVVPTPVLDTHAANKGYVDDARHDWPLNTRTASYTLTLADRSVCVQMNLGTATTLTVPPNSTVAFPVGTTVRVRRLGAGAVTVAAGAGVTINTAASLTLGAQYSTVELHKIATDSWVLTA